MLNLEWTSFKNFIIAKNLSIQWAEDETFYYLSAVETAELFTCRISKTLTGDSTNKTDFETNYKSNGNASVNYVKLTDAAGNGITSTAVSGNRAIDALAVLAGGTDATKIGNAGDRLKVDALVSGAITAVSLPCNIIRQNEMAVTVKIETDVPNSTYTVATGKTFNIVSFGGSYDAQQPMYLRLKKQTGGSGAFVTIFKIVLSINGQDSLNYNLTLPAGLLIGTANDVFKMTYEPAVGRGSVWGSFMGVEY